MLPWTQIYYVYVQQKTCYYHYYQCIRSTETNLFHEERLFNRNHLAGCKFHLQPALCHWPAKKERFRDDQFIIWPRVCSDNNCNSLHLYSREKRVVKDLVFLLK